MSKWHRIREKEVLVGLSFAGNFPVAISFYSDEGLENSCINIMAIIYHHMNYVASDNFLAQSHQLWDSACFFYFECDDFSVFCLQLLDLGRSVDQTLLRSKHAPEGVFAI